jgi:hypothetical protein
VTAVTGVAPEFLQDNSTYNPPSPLAPGSTAQIPDVGGPATSDQKNPHTLQGVGVAGVAGDRARRWSHHSAQ